MKITFLGGSREVGRSAFLLENDKRLLLDYGIKLNSRTEYPLPFQGFIDAVVLSHAHLDHSGFVPAVYEYGNAPCFATYPTQALSALLIKDSMKIQRMNKEKSHYSKNDFRKMMNNLIPLTYNNPLNLTDHTSIMLKDAGHIPGSAITQIEADKKRIVYTGDFKLEETWLHKGAELIEDVDILLIESTYSEKEHPPRKKLEEEFYKETIKVLENGGNALLPSFAVGRSQELVQMLRYFDEDAKIYLDGMAKTASQIILDYPSYVKDAKALRAALESVEWVNSDRQRKKALERPSIIVTTAGLVEGGPVLRYILKLNKNSEIIFTGFQIPGTNGRRILDEHKMELNGIEQNIETPAKYMDFSAHAGRKDLFSFVKKANPEKIFCIHGDTCVEFANDLNAEGYDAVAPKMGDSFNW